jgi:AcrR family transcriptional regulator
MPRGKLVESSERRRQEIMAAALDCFVAKGFSETSMADIQARSGASMGSIYHHFESKERLAAALYLEGLKGVHGAMRSVLTETNQAEEGIKGLVRAYIDWFVQHPQLGYYLFQGMGAQYLEVEGEKIREETTMLRRDLGGWLRPHIQSCEIARLPTELYSPLMLGPTREFLQQWLVHRVGRVRRSPAGPAGATDLSESSQALAEAAWKALASASK